MKALISGISGQVGSYLADFLLEKGYEVHGIVRRAATLEAHPSFRHRLTLHRADLSDQSSLDEVMRDVKPNEVYNLAAQSYVPASWTQPALNGDITGLGVTRMLEATRRHCPTARFYQAGTSELFDRSDFPKDENTPFYPRTPYATAKMYGFQLVRNYRDSAGLYAVNGICFNCESPRRAPEFVTRKITLAAVAIARKAQTGLVLGNLEARRDWGYAAEYVKAIWLTLQQRDPSDYVIATGVHHSVGEFCERAFARVGLNWKDHVTSSPNFRRPSEIEIVVGNPKKLNALGWKAEVSFERLVDMMVDSDLGERTMIKVGRIYRHHKGTRYLVVGLGEDSNNDRKQELTVYYCSVDPGPRVGQWRNRIAEEWCESVPWPSGEMRPRFELEDL